MYTFSRLFLMHVIDVQVTKNNTSKVLSTALNNNDLQTAVLY